MLQVVRELDAADYRDWEGWEIDTAMRNHPDRNLLRLQMKGRVRKSSGGVGRSQSLDLAVDVGDTVEVQIHLRREGT